MTRSAYTHLKSAFSDDEMAAIASLQGDASRHLRGLIDQKRAGDPRIVGLANLGACALDIIWRYNTFQPLLRDVLRACFNTAYRDIVLREVGPDFFLSLGVSTFRTQTVDSLDSHLPYHQDISVYKEDCKALNLWVPLSDCGERSPGMEFVNPHPQRNLVGFEEQQEGQRLGGVDLDMIVRNTAERLETPQLTSGDALVFDECSIHRTHVTPAMTETRTSLELRVFDHIPLAQLKLQYWSSNDLSRLGIL